MADSGYFDVAHSHEDVLTVRWDELEEDALWERLERYKPADPSQASTHGSVSPTTPLFPPSPPGKCTKHPVQILARALRRAQEQNARLERELKRYRLRGADEVSPWALLLYLIGQGLNTRRLDRSFIYVSGRRDCFDGSHASTCSVATLLVFVTCAASQRSEQTSVVLGS